MPEHPAGADVTALVRDGYDLIGEQYLAQAMKPRPHPRHEWLRPDGWFLACLGTTDSPGWLEEDFLGYGGTSWTNGYDVGANRELLQRAGFTLDRAELVEVQEPGGSETWFWVLARRQER